MAVVFLRSKLGSTRTHPSFFNSNILNNRTAKLAELVQRFDNEQQEIEKELTVLRALAPLLPKFFYEFENLKKVSFDAGNVKELERNNQILREFIKYHDAIEFEIRGSRGKNDPLSDAIFAILKDKKVTFDNLIDIFYRK